MQGRATIAPEILESYAADAAREVEGVRGLVDSPPPRHVGVRVLEDGGRLRVELHVAVDWGASIPEVGREVQRRVGAYLQQMANVEPDAVDVIVTRSDRCERAACYGADGRDAPGCAARLSRLRLVAVA